jgi:simple sugar transport system substrate-binding protein
VFVGSLTVPLVNDWANAAIAYQKEQLSENAAG